MSIASRLHRLEQGLTPEEHFRLWLAETRTTYDSLSAYHEGARQMGFSQWFTGLYGRVIEGVGEGDNRSQRERRHAALRTVRELYFAFLRTHAVLVCELKEYNGDILGCAQDLVAIRGDQPMKPSPDESLDA